MRTIWFLLLLTIFLPTQSWAVAVQSAGWQKAEETGIPEPDATGWEALEPGENLNLGITEQPVWLHFTLIPGSEPAVLVIPYSLLDAVDFYWIRNGEVVEEFHTGDLKPFDTRPVPHRYFVFPVPQGEGKVSAVIRVQTTGALQVPVEVLLAEEFIDQDQWAFAWQLLFAGIMLALALYNTVLFLMVRQRAYLWYVLSVVATALVQLNLHGLNYQFLWRGFPAFNEVAMVLLIAVNILAATLFTDTFLRVYKVSRLASWVLRTLALLAALTFIAGFFVPYHTGVISAMLLTYVAAFAAWIIGIFLWYRGQILARFYVIAWTPLLLGNVIVSSSKAGIFPGGPLYNYAPQVGATLEVILLSFALAYRINVEKRMRLEAQEQALLTQREANQTLEIRVRERTSELESANRRLETLSHTDGLTGTANRRRFDDLLDEEWRRALRQHSELSLLLLDIDHFKQVNDDHGHLVGDDCLVWVAETCNAQLKRPGDTLCRYGGEEFVVLLADTSQHGATMLAEKLRQAVSQTAIESSEMHEPLSVTVSIGVATTLPSLNGDPTHLLRCADEALYAAKEAGRNRVMFGSEAGPVAVTEGVSSSACNDQAPEK